MNKALTWKWVERVGIAIAVTAILLGVSMIVGCDGSGGAGGQGTVFNITQTAPPMPIVGPPGDGDAVPLAALIGRNIDAKAGAATNILIINYNIQDGGTFANPSVGWGGAAVATPTATAPTTQPSTPVR